MEKLPEDFKKRWVEALRSGKYKQGQYSLYSNGYYCCLGVAGLMNGLSNEEMYNKSSLACPIYKEVTPVPLDDCILNTLTGMNDGTGPESSQRKSFYEIADYIEQNL